MWKIDQKIGQWNIKTKIYQIIESIIILFIKLQFFNQVYQAFRLLCTSTSNLDLNFSRNSSDLIFYIILHTFISSLIYLFYNSRFSLY